MNATENKEPTFEDVEMDVPPAGAEFSTIPEGVYKARLVGFTTTDKPDWLLKGEEDEDRKQWMWTFEITEGECQGVRLNNYTNRSWHERANAHKHAAALLGVPSLPVGIGMSTRQLAGKGCQIWVVEKGTKKDPTDLRNYIDKVTPLPAARMRPARPQAPEKPAVPYVSVPALASADEDEIDF